MFSLSLSLQVSKGIMLSEAEVKSWVRIQITDEPKFYSEIIFLEVTLDFCSYRATLQF
jgi:hypothetical protein